MVVPPLGRLFFLRKLYVSGVIKSSVCLQRTDDYERKHRKIFMYKNPGIHFHFQIMVIMYKRRTGIVWEIYADDEYSAI